MCARNGCENEGQFKPVLELRSRKNGPVTEITFTTLVLCLEHTKNAKIETFLPKESFIKLIKTLREAGKETPVRRLSVLNWKPVNNLHSEIRLPNDENEGTAF